MVESVMKLNLIVRRYFSFVFALVAIPALRAGETVTTNPMNGIWEGSTHVIVTWCEQKELTVSLHIQANGSVTGKVGDAELVNARLKKKWSWFVGKDSQRTTHIIEGDLKGPIVTAEGISRKKVFIHLRTEGAHLSGSLATSGFKIGGKDRMILTATSLWLAPGDDDGSGGGP